jgi:RNA polymerase sigma-70 factor (ECF subfamily)
VDVEYAAGVTRERVDNLGSAGALVALVERARDPDLPLLVRQEAFGALVERFQDLAYAYAYALLGDPHLAQDAAQETFLAAYRHLDQLRTPAAFSSWLRQIVRTQCGRLRRGKEPLAAPDALGSLDSLEGTGTARAAPRRSEAPLTATTTTTIGGDPAAEVESRELRAAVVRALQTLPAREREATVLFYFAGYAQPEIAAFLRVPANTVKKRLQSARKRLQERMLEMADDALHEYGRERLPSRDDRFAETVRFLLAFDSAAAEGELPLVELLLVDGFDVNDRDADGRTLLSWAAQRGHLDAAELLLRHGADANARDRTGITPLAWAERAGHRTLAALLRRHGGTR